MKRFGFFTGAVFATCLLWAFTACESEKETIVAVPLEKPAITVAAEKEPNPIVLEFAWSTVENADLYEYRLDAPDGKIVASGAIAGTTLELPASNLVPVQSGTTYDFTVRACATDEERFTASEYAEKSVATTPSDFKLSISNVTYRSADMFCETEDEEMKYYLTYITQEKYAEYGSDEVLFEEHEKGYAKAAGPAMGVAWYMFMEGMAATGVSYGFHTGALKPDKDYYMYAYGIKANVEAFDIELITAIEKLPFRTLAWKPTIECAFEIVPKSLTAEQVSFLITPSKNDVTYYFGIVPVELVEKDYDNNMDEVTRDILYQMEALNDVHWDDPGVLLEGPQTITYGADVVASGIQSGAKYYALAFGVDTEGLQTTLLSKITFDAPVTAPETSAQRSRRNRTPQPPLRGADRMPVDAPLLIL